MSLLNAMYTGVSGLNAEGDALSVVGDNVSNSNTVGFKESRAVFEDVMNSAIATPNAAGAGVHMAEAQQILQGGMQNTGQPTDLAISGDGFFVVNGSMNGVNGNFYTRAGNTALDKTGTLVNPNGLALQGYPILPNGQTSSQLGSIKLQTAALSPSATQAMTITANLDSNSQPPAAAWDPQNPTSTSNFATSMQVFDSLGNSHQVSVYFANTGANQWSYHEIAAGGEVQGGTAGQNVEIGFGNDDVHHRRRAPVSHAERRDRGLQRRVVADDCAQARQCHRQRRHRHRRNHAVRQHQPGLGAEPRRLRLR